MKRIAIFASGNGTNAENIIRYFQASDLDGEVALVISNNPEAKVIQRGRNLGVDTKVMTRHEINTPTLMLGLLDEYSIDIIVLAGFMLIIPPFLIERYPDHIVNIHPALLPKYGGKGMYGHHVHEAVVAAGENETGITVHFVERRYDEGRIIFQAKTSVTPEDTPAEVEEKIHMLESRHFPRVIAETFLK